MCAQVRTVELMLAIAWTASLAAAIVLGARLRRSVDGAQRLELALRDVKARLWKLEVLRRSRGGSDPRSGGVEASGPRGGVRRGGAEDSRLLGEEVSWALDALAAHLSADDDAVRARAAEGSECARATGAFRESIARAEASAKETASISGAVSTEAERGYRAVHKAIDQLERLHLSMEALRGRIDALGTRVAEIGDVGQLIREIAERTNILSLNASILAAHAGDHGRGFAVVAREVKALAERTASFTQKITEQVNGIREETERASEGARSGVDAVREGREVSLAAGDALDDIRQLSLTASKRALGVVRILDDQAVPASATTSEAPRPRHRAK